MSGEGPWPIKPSLRQTGWNYTPETPAAPTPKLPLPSDSQLPTKPFEHELRYQPQKLFQPKSATPSTPSEIPTKIGVTTILLEGMAAGAAILFGLGLFVVTMGAGLAVAGLKEEKKPEERIDFPLTDEERLLVQEQIQKSPGDRALWAVAVQTGSRKEIDLILKHAKEGEVLQLPGIASDLFADLPSADILPERIADPGQPEEPLDAPSSIPAGETIKAPGTNSSDEVMQANMVTTSFDETFTAKLKNQWKTIQNRDSDHLDLLRKYSTNDIPLSRSLAETILAERSRELGVDQKNIMVVVPGHDGQEIEVLLWLELGVHVIALDMDPSSTLLLQDEIEILRSQGKTFPNLEIIDAKSRSAALGKGDIVVWTHPSPRQNPDDLRQYLKDDGVMLVQTEFPELTTIFPGETQLFSGNVDDRHYFCPSPHVRRYSTNSKLFIVKRIDKP